MTTPTIADLEVLAEFARKHGLRHLKAGDVEMEFQAPSDPIDVAKAKALTDQFMAGVPDDESMLYWSAYQPVDPNKGAVEGDEQ